MASSGPIRALHHQFADLAHLESHAIDTTTLSPATTLAAVRDALVAGTGLLTPRPRQDQRQQPDVPRPPG